MPTQQPDQTFTPNEAAIMLGTAAHNVRRWTEYHAAHLSPLATPPPGQARRYNGRDIEVLKHVKALRSQGLTVPVINEQLAGLTFAEIDTSAADSVTIASVGSQEGVQQAPGVIVALQAIEQRIDAIERKRLDTVTAIGIGICIGLLFAAILISLAWLYGG
jgi:DNA-binding transcriptional MerR regulator